MKYDPSIHHRRTIRLRDYDYAQAGMYFVTICSHQRVCLFGEISSGGMLANDAGRIVRATWDALPEHYAHVSLDAFIAMPNHVHGILVMDSALAVGAGLKPAPTPPTRHGLPEVVRAFKTFSSRRINEQRQTPGEKVWQRNYWERVIRNDEELRHIREYIQNNPAQWALDRLHPQSGWFEKAVGAGFKPAPTGAGGLE